MLSRPTQRKLALYFLGMMGLHAYMLWQAAPSIPQGLPDFSIFYTAGRMVRDGHGAHLYDDAAQESEQRRFSPSALRRRGSILPYNHPPFEAIVFAPLARFSYLTAYLIWLLVNLTLLAATVLILRNRLSGLRSIPLYLWVLAGLAFFPIFIALIQGQDSILMLFLYALAFASLERGAEAAAGSWLALGLHKYHLVVPFIAPLWRRVRLIAGFAGIALLLGGASLAVSGWQTLQRYPRYVWATEHDVRYVWNSPHGNTANLRGLTSAVVPEDQALARTILLLLFSALTLALMVYATRRARFTDPSERHAVIALNLFGTTLLSYHIYVHDLSILFPAILLLFELLQSGAAMASWARKALYACAAILFCSPVYMVLTLRYSQLQLLAIVFIAIFAGLLQLLRTLPDQAAGAEPPPASAGR